jgi:hypothetical protein
VSKSDSMPPRGDTCILAFGLARVETLGRAHGDVVYVVYVIIVSQLSRHLSSLSLQPRLMESFDSLTYRQLHIRIDEMCEGDVYAGEQGRAWDTVV